MLNIEKVPNHIYAQYRPETNQPRGIRDPTQRKVVCCGIIHMRAKHQETPCNTLAIDTFPADYAK